MGMLKDQTSREYVAIDESQRSRKSMDERGKWTLEKKVLDQHIRTQEQLQYEATVQLSKLVIATSSSHLKS